MNEHAYTNGGVEIAERLVGSQLAGLQETGILQSWSMLQQGDVYAILNVEAGKGSAARQALAAIDELGPVKRVDNLPGFVRGVERG